MSILSNIPYLNIGLSHGLGPFKYVNTLKRRLVPIIIGRSLGPFKYVNTLKHPLDDPYGDMSLGPFKYVNTLKPQIVYYYLISQRFSSIITTFSSFSY